MTVQSKLTSDLHALGVRPGGILLVHSSLRSLGTDSRGQRLGAETVIKSLLEALGPEVRCSCLRSATRASGRITRSLTSAIRPRVSAR